MAEFLPAVRDNAEGEAVLQFLCTPLSGKDHNSYGFFFGFKGYANF